MSGLTGVAQFTNRFAQNIMGYEQDKKNEAERVADKERELARQAQQDKNAQENHDLGYQADTLKLDEAKDTRTDSVNQRNYSKTYNQIQYFKQMGDESGAIDAIVQGANSHSDLPYKINVERDVNGKVASRTDENGNTYYFQNIIDKETGKVIRTDSVTYEQLMEGYNQLQNGEAIAAEKAAYAAEIAKQQRKDQSELSLYTAKKGVDVEADNIKAKRDHIYKIDEMGVKHGYTIDELGVRHGFTIDELGVRHANAVDLSNVNAQNNIGIRTAQSDLDAGGTPIVGGGDDVQSIINSLTGTESSGNSAAFRTNTDGRNFGGLIQMGDARLQDYATATGTAPITATQFKNLPAAQQRAVNEWHISDLTKAAQATGAVGKVINGVPVTLSGLVAVGHLGGKGGMNKFVQTNGRYNPKDQLGTSLTDYLTKHSSGPIQVQRSVPGVPKAPKGGSKKVESVAATNTAKDYDAVITKGLSETQKSLKSLGLKPDATSTAILAETAALLRDMGKAGSAQEVSDIYGDVYLSAQKAIPASKLRQMTKAQRSALTNQIIYSIAGVSSAKEIRQAIERFNPAARGGGSVTAGGLTLPGQQARTPAPTRQTTQTGKLQALYSRGLTPPKTDPAAAESFDYMNNLNDNMDW
ncbi:hypothetical protein BTW00_02320 [Psychrobacter sp. C 20.9]|uniref:hypothetical protein n=1 Tax=Psychrobacter sp. C 20.9 TaxID=1926477 RepID=UPI0009468DFF|nr:hypothetical protein [Psychrobacter sp. C 20.9]OLF38014.1 hypothetical protein BTW00_02320 [Psychrobacter sp. C 20.9]